MIIGIGTDLVDIRRIENLLARFGPRFKDRYFTPAERNYAEDKKNGAHYAGAYAKRFAAKEACAKAMGTGFRNGLFLKHIAVINDHLGRPEIVLSKQAVSALSPKIPENSRPHIHLSLSDEYPYAQAFVIIEAKNT